MVSNEQFRSAMSKFATGVTVITTMDEDGKPHEMTANSFTSVCLDPPTILVCAAHSTNSFGYLDKNFDSCLGALKIIKDGWETEAIPKIKDKNIEKMSFFSKIFGKE